MRSMREKTSAVGRRVLAVLVFVSMLALMIPFVPVSAQTESVTATPGYINLGLTTSIVATAPAAGSYTIVVEKPSGVSSSLAFSATSAGQTQTETYGNATSGFGAVVSQVGTYNVYLEQGTTVVSSTSFYATNKLNISIEMVTGGTCDYVSGITRGEKMFPHTYITYASTGASWTNTAPGWSVKATSPTGIVAMTWDPYSIAFELGVLPNWNYTAVGNYSPDINASDAAGNVGIFKYSGSPFTITPATLSTNVQLIDTKTNQTVTSLYSGETVKVVATITYPTNAEPVTGFVGPLDAAARGGVVNALFGYGYWNSTASTFGGSAKNPGTLMGSVPLTYTGANGTWTGQYTATTLPSIPAGTTYEMAVTSSDKASPPNTGVALVGIGASPAPEVTTSVVTSTSTSISTMLSTTTSVLTTTLSQVVQSIPSAVYAGMIVLLALGLIIGMLMRPRK